MVFTTLAEESILANIQLRKFNNSMKKSLLLIFVCGVLSLNTGYTQSLKEYFGAVNSFLSTYVQDGRVSYKKVAGNFGEAKSIYKMQCDMDLSKASADTKKAFYINAYNLIVVYQVAKYYEFNSKSPMDQSGFFDKIKHKVGGEMMTLNQLEIKKLLMPYRDARIHFVLACAAKSCPPLASFAYIPEKLDDQLDTRTKLAVNNKEWLRLKKESKKVMLSKIFDWYKRDFTMNGVTTIQFINKYRKEPIPGNFKIDYYEYDWSLNNG